MTTMMSMMMMMMKQFLLVIMMISMWKCNEHVIMKWNATVGVSVCTDDHDDDDSL